MSRQPRPLAGPREPRQKHRLWAAQRGWSALKEPDPNIFVTSDFPSAVQSGPAMPQQAPSDPMDGYGSSGAAVRGGQGECWPRREDQRGGGGRAPQRGVLGYGPSTGALPTRARHKPGGFPRPKTCARIGKERRAGLRLSVDSCRSRQKFSDQPRNDNVARSAALASVPPLAHHMVPPATPVATASAKI